MSDEQSRMIEWRYAATDLALSLIEHYQDINANNSLKSQSVKNIMNAISYIEELAQKDKDWIEHYEKRAEQIKERK
jgi:hypothetical protein